MTDKLAAFFVLAAACFAFTGAPAVAQPSPRADVRSIVIGDRIMSAAICGPDRFVFVERSPAPPAPGDLLSFFEFNVDAMAPEGGIEKSVAAHPTGDLLSWFEFSVDAKSPDGGRRRLLWRQTVHEERFTFSSEIVTCDAEHKLIGLRGEAVYWLTSYDGSPIADVQADAQIGIGVDEIERRFWVFWFPDFHSGALPGNENSHHQIVPLRVERIADGNGSPLLLTIGHAEQYRDEWHYIHYIGSTGGLYVLRQEANRQQGEIARLEVDDAKKEATPTPWRPVEFMASCAQHRFATGTLLKLKAMHPYPISCRMTGEGGCCERDGPQRNTSPKAGATRWLSIEESRPGSCLAIRDSGETTGSRNCVSDVPGGSPGLLPDSNDWALVAAQTDHRFRLTYKLTLVQLLPTEAR